MQGDRKKFTVGVVGVPRTGKTALINQYLGGDSQSIADLTTGNISYHVLRPKLADLVIIESYRSPMDWQYDAIMFVFNTSTSFSAITGCKYRISELRQQGCRIALVGTHIDLGVKVELSEVMVFADATQTRYFPISIKDLQQVREVFSFLVAPEGDEKSKPWDGIWLWIRKLAGRIRQKPKSGIWY